MKHDGNKMVIFLIYVDYLIITSDDHARIKEVKAILWLKFKISYRGDLKFLLGIEIMKTKVVLFLVQ